jgi:glycine oxidase
VLRPQDHPYQQLTGLSHALHAQWAKRLRDQTGIDTGHARCGGLYLARNDSAATELQQFAEHHRRRNIAAQWLEADEIAHHEPALAWRQLRGACLLADECQLRNPRHVKALLAGCQAQGVTIESGRPIDDFMIRGGRVTAACSLGEELTADQFCITSGAWSRGLLDRLHCPAPIKPIRGQIALLSGPRVLTRVINDGHRYLVPRADGRVLVGSTEEDAGFDKRNTAEAIANLLAFAVELFPALRHHTVERNWAGLRPGNGDGFPYLGRLPNLENAFVAAGHYRHGLHLSPGTAVVMAQLLLGQELSLDLTPFRIDR